MVAELKIKQFIFSNDSAEIIHNQEKLFNIDWGNNWPIIYILTNEEEAYVGETYKLNERLKQHLQDPKKGIFKKINIIIDPKSNKSYSLDVESHLIRYMSADSRFEIKNGNKGLVNYNYFNKKKYLSEFDERIWEKLRACGLAIRSLKDIENDEIFKFSPYTPLGIQQNEVIFEILNKISSKNKGSIIVNGSAGTGKTLLGTYLMKLLNSEDDIYEEDLIKKYLLKFKGNSKRIGFVIPQQSLRKTLKRVFKKISGLNSKMIISPNEVVKEGPFDLLLVDESHRLRKRKNLSNYFHFDENNKFLKLPKESTELDWILNMSRLQIFFYDSDQSIKPTDISNDYFYNKLSGNIISEQELFSQFRNLAGEDYIKYIKKILSGTQKEKKSFSNYDLKLFDDMSELKKEILLKNKEHKLSRLVAGYGWKWNSKKDLNNYDIEIDGIKFKWNTTSTDWVSHKDSINEIGCIHTIQGYDLNYAGIIFGPEVTFDEETNSLKIIKENYFDQNGKKGISEQELLKYIKNIYSVLLTRGIKGTYIYVCDDKLRNYLKKFI